MSKGKYYILGLLLFYKKTIPKSYVNITIIMMLVLFISHLFVQET